MGCGAGVFAAQREIARKLIFKKVARRALNLKILKYIPGGGIYAAFLFGGVFAVPSGILRGVAA
jgi:hypothetical protein